MISFEKQPSEVLDYTFDFSLVVATGDSLAAVPPPVVTIEVQDGDAIAPTLGAMTLNTLGHSVKQRISGGVADQVCLVTCLVTTINGEVIEGEVRLKIREKQ